MKPLKPYDKVRQELWEHEGRTFSIVNLIIPPLELNGERAGGKFIDLMFESYSPRIYELAELKKNNIEIIGRFKSNALARTGIKVYLTELQEKNAQKNS